MASLKYVFVHGLSGWGSYDKAYARMPYWGMRNGDLIAFLREKGYDCHAASVDPIGSAWDRACELYAQLYGKRVDYGKAHSEKYGHERFGRDFSSCPLGKESSSLVLIGHSFGGTTIRLFSELMANGDEEEKRATPEEELSPLFKGGLEGSIFSIITLASPINGTTAYDLTEDPDFDQKSVKVSLWHRFLGSFMTRSRRRKTDGRRREDYAAFDMHVDNALALNERIPTFPGIYYFSVPCCYTSGGRPKKGMEGLFVMASARIGAYTGKTKGGFVIDNSWRENDGLVNTISEKAPFGAPSKDLDRSSIERGVWNVFPVLDTDHMWFQGGLMHRHDIKDFYLDLLGLAGNLV